MNEQVSELKKWYEQHVRPLLSTHTPSKIADFDQVLQRIEAVDRRVNEELAICFLGASGVGKSTLINALVGGAEQIVPAGGVGPLTALAMEVRYDEKPAFEAQYHNARRLWQGVIFPLERGYAAMLKEQTGKAADSIPPADLPPVEGEEDDAVATDDSGDSTEATARLERFTKQAQLLIKGNQDVLGDLPYLLDCLREACGSKRVWETTTLPADENRVARLKAALALGREKRRHRCDPALDAVGFRRELREHASGFLAPIIRSLEVRWDAPLLKDRVVLVDLPGVGIAGDVYKEVTQEWIYKRARAVVLVVDRSGITESAAELLKSSDFLTRLLFSNDEREHDPVMLAVAMTRLDDVAAEERSNDRDKTTAEHLALQFAKADDVVRGQVRLQLERVWVGPDSGATGGKRHVIEHLASSLRVFPVSAPQYRKLLAEDDEQRAFIKDAQQSGIPRLQAELLELVERRRHSARVAREEMVYAFASQVLAQTALIRAQWEGDGHTEQENVQLEKDLAVAMEPLKKQFHVRQGEFRGFLKNTVPEQILALVAKARTAAEKDMNSYLQRLRDAHWGTLRAAVRREGTFYGSRHINLPDDFTQRFVEPVAEVWGQQIVQKIRKQSREFAQDCEALVVALAEWCRGQGTRVSDNLLDAQLDAIRADVKQIDVAGRDIINELRDRVKDRLGAIVRKPISRKCKAFVDAHHDVGAGVKNRILELFRDLASECSDVAETAAGDLLLACFKEVEVELKTALKELESPLDNAADDILRTHRRRVEREDARKKDSVLTEISTVVAACPPCLRFETEAMTA